MRGKEEKELIAKKIFEVFPNAFMDGKIIRIPINEVEIKVQLTCAKDVIGGDAGVNASTSSDGGAFGGMEDPKSAPVEPTEEEVENLRKMMDKLGL